MKVLGISGSLRQGSYNTALLRAAPELAPPGMQIEPFEIGNFPLYNEDLRVAGLPPAVQAFRQAIQAADALLFATPEYNYSVPGVLKNAIDWASRPPNDQPLAGKPVAIMGASTGNFGTVRAQMHLRQMCVFLDMHPLNKPEVLVFRAAEKFDAQGHLVDATTRDLVRGLLLALRDWTHRLRASG